MATIDVYSVPCAPETKATVGPGFTPRTTATPIVSAESLPAGIAIVPYAVFPGAAVAEPTVNAVVCCAKTGATEKTSVATAKDAQWNWFADIEISLSEPW
jgi:hypothetical protein